MIRSFWSTSSITASAHIFFFHLIIVQWAIGKTPSSIPYCSNKMEYFFFCQLFNHLACIHLQIHGMLFCCSFIVLFIFVSFLHSPQSIGVRSKHSSGFYLLNRICSRLNFVVYKFWVFSMFCAWCTYSAVITKLTWIYFYIFFSNLSSSFFTVEIKPGTCFFHSIIPS